MREETCTIQHCVAALPPVPSQLSLRKELAPAHPRVRPRDTYWKPFVWRIILRVDTKSRRGVDLAR